MSRDDGLTAAGSDGRGLPGEYPVSRAGAWIRLGLCLLGIAVFMFVVGPWVSDAPFVRPLVRFIDEHDIEASALFYTEVEAFSEADVHMRNTMRHAPRVREDHP